MSDLAEIPVVIFAGGRGARFNHETEELPKPMIQVCGRPIIDHIIDSFVDRGFREFIIATGYLGEKIREHFASPPWSVFAHNLDAGIQHSSDCRRSDVRSDRFDCVFVKCHDTGEDSHTGERLRRLREVLAGRRFVLTYGDGLSDVSMCDVIEMHERPVCLENWQSHPASQRPVVTLTAVLVNGRFGVLRFNGTFSSHVRSFEEKVPKDFINGGFMVCEPALLDLLDTGIELESEALPQLADDWLLRAHRHHGYWRCMDTRRDLEQIERDVEEHGGPPWRAFQTK